MKARFIIKPPDSTEIYNAQRLPTLFSRKSLGRGALRDVACSCGAHIFEGLSSPQPLLKRGDRNEWNPSRRFRCTSRGSQKEISRRGDQAARQVSLSYRAARLRPAWDTTPELWMRCPTRPSNPSRAWPIHFRCGSLKPGERVVDLGSGAGSIASSQPARWAHKDTSSASI